MNRRIDSLNLIFCFLVGLGMSLFVLIKWIFNFLFYEIGVMKTPLINLGGASAKNRDVSSLIKLKLKRENFINWERLSLRLDMKTFG